MFEYEFMVNAFAAATLVAIAAGLVGYMLVLRGETFAGEDAGLSVGAGGGQEEAVELSVIDRGLRTLPDEQREAVLLVMVEGYSYKEAAAIVGCPVGTLNSRQVRGRDALLAWLGDGV